jgi:signal peptidase II
MAAVGAVAAVLDLATKEWVFRAIPMREERSVIDGFLVFRPLYNTAGPWSWGHGLEWLRWGLPIVSVVAVLVIGRLWIQSDPADRAKGLGLALILGGALGNLWDRSLAIFRVYDGVRDFVLFPNIVFGDPFPAFNLADTWITVGVVLVGWRMLFEKESPSAPGVPPGGRRVPGAPPAGEAAA